jgi:enoyl-CoA hydratase
MADLLRLPPWACPDRVSRVISSSRSEGTLGPFETLRVERRGPVGWITFDRPDAGHAMNATMFDELERAWLQHEADPDVRVIVNTGSGDTFQTGVDVKQMARDRDALRRFSRQTRDATLRFTSWHLGVTKPVIAAVNGTCAGGGLHFVADADIVLASTNATFLDPHVSVGQVVAYEGITLARKSPAESVLRMALVGRGERITAARAQQLGIVGQLVHPPDSLRDEAQSLAERVAQNPPAVLAATKKALWAALESGRSEDERNRVVRI